MLTQAIIAPEQIRAQLDRTLLHPLFAAAERRARLMRFLVDQSLDGHAGDLKEQVIAAEVFDRSADYDPKIDSLVRVEMGRLRSRLIEYYAGAGRNDPIQIDFPKGSYAPVFTQRVIPLEAQVAVRGAGLPTSLPRRWKWPVTGLALVCAAATAAWYLPGLIQPAAQPSLAVLPFLNLTGDANNEFLSDGISDEITGVLAEAGSLRVVARTSAFQFKGRNADVRDIGRALNAGAVLEGSVAQQNGRLRIVAQLIRSGDGFHLWAQTFDFPPQDLQKTEGEVARGALRSLVAGQPDRVGASLLMSTKNPEAHDLSLRARSAFLRGTLESTQLSVQLAQQAIDKDPSYPVAWYLRGIAESTLGRFGIVPAKESLERGLASFEQAIELNRSYGDAHASHAVNVWFYYWDWPRAEEEFKLALRLGSQQAPNLYGATMAMRGQRVEEAHRQLAIAETLDPMATAPRLNRAGLWAIQGEIAKARAEYNRVLEQNPAEITAIIALSALDLAEKNCTGAAEKSARLDKIGPGMPFSLTTRAWVWASCGRRMEALRLRDELDAAQPPGLSFFGMAMVDGALGDYDRGFDHLRRAADGRESLVLTIAANPAFKPFDRDPRYIALVKRLGLDR